MEDRAFFYVAYGFAHAAHKGQADKGGKPYIEHPKRVANNLEDFNDKAVGMLHDVVEDCNVTLEELLEIFPQFIVTAVDAITRRKDESQDAYLDRVVKNDIARRVKIKDVEDNLLPERISPLDPDTRARLRSKYTKALEFLTGVKEFFDMAEGCYVRATPCANGHYKLEMELEQDRWVPYSSPFLSEKELEERIGENTLPSFMG